MLSKYSNFKQNIHVQQAVHYFLVYTISTYTCFSVLWENKIKMNHT